MSMPSEPRAGPDSKDRTKRVDKPKKYSHGTEVHFCAQPGDDPLLPGDDLYITPILERKGENGKINDLCGMKCPEYPNYRCSKHKSHAKLEGSDHAAYGQPVCVVREGVITESQRRIREELELPMKPVTPMFARWSLRKINLGRKYMGRDKNKE